jgi:hypothetical protein
MTTYHPGRENGHDGTDLDDRDIRALTQLLTVIPEAPGLYEVVSQSGSAYTVDTQGSGACTCPDFKHNLPTDDGRETCKHQARVAYETGERPLPAWIDTDELPDDFALHVDATPTVAVTDGGSEIIDAGDDGEILDGSDDDGRPDDCGCWNTEQELPCFPCYREGFRSQNPDTPAAGE